MQVCGNGKCWEDGMQFFGGGGGSDIRKPDMFPEYKIHSIMIFSAFVQCKVPLKRACPED